MSYTSENLILILLVTVFISILLTIYLPLNLGLIYPTRPAKPKIHNYYNADKEIEHLRQTCTSLTYDIKLHELLKNRGVIHESS